MLPDGREDWQQDLSIPTDPPQPGVHTFKSAIRVLGRSFQNMYGTAVVQYFEAVGEGYKKIFAAIDPAAARDTTESLGKFPHDPPTNRVYPTSFDSWCNEYDQPMRRSQQYVRKSRKTRRR